MRYDTVLFDLDHTLLDSDASLAGAYEVTMRSVGVADPASFYPAFDRINRSLWRRVEAHELSPNDVRVLRFCELTAELGIDADPEEMAATFVEGLITHGELFAGARALLDELVAARRLALVTNGIGRVQRGRIARLGLDVYFEVVTVSGEVGVNKPGREIFDITFDALGVADRSSSVMVGDNLGSDVAGGSNAGVDTIWFNPADEAPGEHTPTHTVGALSEISSLVR